MGRAPRVLLAAAYALGVLLVAVPRVLAHGVPVSTSPAANAILERSPPQIEIFFSEALETGYSSIAVLDGAGAELPRAIARVDTANPARMTLRLRSMQPGVYTVVWQALSAVDGHVTRGTFAFAVGRADAASLATAAAAGSSGASTTRLAFAEVAARWLLQAGAALLVGVPLFVLRVWLPAAGTLPAGNARPPNWPLLTEAALLLALPGHIAALLVQAGHATGAEYALPWDAAVGGILFATRFGFVWLLRTALLALIVALPPPGAAAAAGRALAAGAALVFTLSLGSHAAAEAQALLPLGADWLHALAAGVWLGGLGAFAVALAAQRAALPAERSALVRALLPRFSSIVVSAVALLGITGLYAAGLRVGGWEALAGKAYGRVLAAKLLLFGALLALGAYNLLRLTPMAAHSAAHGLRAAGILQRTLKIEAGLGGAVLLCVGLLTTLPPARVNAVAPSIEMAGSADDLQFTLAVAPGRVGINTFTLHAATTSGALADVAEVQLRFTPRAGGVPASTGKLQAVAAGTFSGQGAYLSLPQAWQLQAVVRRPGKYDAFANFDLDLRSSARRVIWQQLCAGALLLAAAACAAGVARAGHSRLARVAWGAPPGVALLLAGGFVFMSVPPPEPDALINPVASSAQSVAIGATLFAQNCAVCHGPAGLGNGPLSVTFNPRPADLSQHAVPGVHSDGELFDWITNGYPGAAMPGWRSVMNESERWHMVNFIRTLALNSAVP